MVRMNRRFAGIAFGLLTTLSASAGLAVADNPPTSSAGACFSTDSRNKSLNEVPCNLSTIQAAARSGEVFAQNQLGLVAILKVENGSDIREARAWFEKAARRGYAPAQINLAVTYINGWGIPKLRRGAQLACRRRQTKPPTCVRQPGHPLYERLGSPPRLR